MKDHCNKNHKALIKKIEQDKQKLERYPVFLDWKNFKMSMLPKMIYRFNAI
jgi:hypothetical protein